MKAVHCQFAEGHIRTAPNERTMCKEATELSSRESRALEKQRQAAQALLQERKDTQEVIGILTAPDTFTAKLVSDGEVSGTGVVRYNKRLGVAVYSAE